MPPRVFHSYFSPRALWHLERVWRLYTRSPSVLLSMDHCKVRKSPCAKPCTESLLLGSDMNGTTIG